MNSALFVVVLITGLALVGAALLIAGLISPRSFNPQKGEAYECGIPSRGESWMQFKVGYYSVFDVRRRNGILVPVGGYIERFRCSRII